MAPVFSLVAFWIGILLFDEVLYVLTVRKEIKPRAREDEMQQAISMIIDIVPEPKSRYRVCQKGLRRLSNYWTRLMPSSKRPKRLLSPGEDMESIFAMSSMDPEWDTEALS